MEGGEGSLNHSDYEDDFAEAGLRWESYSKDKEETYKTSCTGTHSVAGGSSRTFLHDELLYKILLRLLRVG